MEYPPLEEDPRQGIQALTENLQSQSTGEHQVSSQTSTSAAEVLVRTAVGRATGYSG
jgi:hypothetical protein